MSFWHLNHLYKKHLNNLGPVNKMKLWIVPVSLDTTVDSSVLQEKKPKRDYVSTLLNLRPVV